MIGTATTGAMSRPCTRASCNCSASWIGSSTQKTTSPIARRPGYSQTGPSTCMATRRRPARARPWNTCAPIMPVRGCCNNSETRRMRSTSKIGGTSLRPPFASETGTGTRSARASRPMPWLSSPESRSPISMLLSGRTCCQKLASQRFGLISSPPITKRTSSMLWLR